MANDQNHKCALCEKDELEVGTLGVDHRYIEGYERLKSEEKMKYIRQLLCRNCNTAIGLLKEDMNILDKAKIYLERWSNKL
jgi:hypothetical protein